MSKIAIVTDSTSDIPKELVSEWDISVIPLAINFGAKQYLDGVDIQSDEFYNMLASTQQLPTTSQPSPAEFQEVYQRLLQEYDSIVSIHLSSGLSGTLESAYLARETMQNDNIHIIDSKSISLGTGLLVSEAVQLRKAGLAVKEIVSRVETAVRNIEVLFTLDTLEYLHKGGRIGKVQAIMGSLLNIKPVVKVVDGIYVPAGKARKTEQALAQIENLCRELTAGRTVKRFVVAHGAAVEAGKQMITRLEELFKQKVGVFTQVGPVIGVHTGPGTVGVGVLME